MGTIHNYTLRFKKYTQLYTKEIKEIMEARAKEESNVETIGQWAFKDKLLERGVRGGKSKRGKRIWKGIKLRESSF